MVAPDSMPSTSDEATYDAIIIGAGFGGCYALHKFRQLGLRTHLFEAGTAPGGVWHWNRYPGARVDSEIPFYQFSLREVWRDWNWSERFPGHEELRAYFKHVDSVLELSKDISYSSEVVAATYDNDKAQWRVKTQNGSLARCTYLICATGSSIKAHRPDFKDMDKYKGELIHSAQWPEHFDANGKRIAVVGAGASGVQCVQELTKDAAHLTSYIRTAAISLPMGQRKLGDLEQRANKGMYNAIFKLCRETRQGLGCEAGPPGSMKDVDPAVRERLFEELWARGGFYFAASNYRDYVFDPESNNIIYQFWAKKTRERIKNPTKAAFLAPETAPFAFGTKRSCLEQNYYECLDQDHVDIVDLKTNPIKAFTETGIISEDNEERKFDAIILATGFDSMTGSLTSMGMLGKDGIDMKERWKNGVFTYLAPTALTNGPVFLEIQVDFLVDMITKMRKENITTIEPQHDAEVKWKQDIQDMNNKTLFRFTDSWYMGSNIPGKPREQLNYLAGIPQYDQDCRAAIEQWTGFNVTYSR
ncbi:hypothetical protein AMS68_000454 [Peltaster fructicola]|uniref:FAD/NAD(P)-binding domain-containing protein n=1 Tax=Peltaster fructicola TaxID=286661 RepID=A0A6H0XJN1_9PEZI|nr:hypothetical protein AMS68_000454 [Peltaster fructicola]